MTCWLRERFHLRVCREQDHENQKILFGGTMIRWSSNFSVSPCNPELGSDGCGSDKHGFCEPGHQTPPLAPEARSFDPSRDVAHFEFLNCVANRFYFLPTDQARRFATLRLSQLRYLTFDTVFIGTLPSRVLYERCHEQFQLFLWSAENVTRRLRDFEKIVRQIPHLASL